MPVKKSNPVSPTRERGIDNSVSNNPSLDRFEIAQSDTARSHFVWFTGTQGYDEASNPGLKEGTPLG